MLVSSLPSNTFLQNCTIEFPENRYEAKQTSIYHKMMPYLKDIRKLDRHISPEMRSKIHEIMSGLHEKIRQYVIEQNLAKYGTSTGHADRVSTSPQKDSFTFVRYAPQNLDSWYEDRNIGN